MGGFGSGRRSGQPTVDMSLRIDIAWMIRSGRAKSGSLISGSLSWTCGGEPSGSISYQADMTDINAARLILNYRRGSNESAKHLHQDIRMTYTTPNYGGRRWWMICPYKGTKVGKLYLPAGGDYFASRNAWRLGYQSQRIAGCDRPFEALYRLQKKLGGPQGWEAGLSRRPKGMWHRSYDRLWDEYYRLDDQCSIEMALMMRRLGAL